MIKRISQLLLLALAIHYIPKFCRSKTAGFTIPNIQSHLAYNSDWEVANPPLPEIFNQSFSYFSAGGQCYVFLSEDGNYVLKFFKHHQRRLPFLVEYLPLPAKWAAKREKQRARRLKKLQRDYRSYKLAIEQLEEETGLLYVHLNQTTDLKKSARIIDKLNITHRVPLDQVGFIVQKRASLALPHLSELIEAHDIPLAKSAIESVCNLILTRCEKGIYDEDAKIHRNFGFIDNRAILIDVGRLRPDPRRTDPKIQQADLFKITKRLDDYLSSMSPELSEHLHTYLQERIHD
ncbi:MAG: hypothetical protein K1000chlam2_00483 [Chlamydiae bacterium]|nr:hypothetical protein [Chlamydiota bacterium]